MREIKKKTNTVSVSGLISQAKSSSIAKKQGAIIRSAQIMALAFAGIKGASFLSDYQLGFKHTPHDTMVAGDESLLPPDVEFFAAKLKPLNFEGTWKPVHPVYQTEIDGKPYFVKESSSFQSASEIAAKRFADELGIGDHVLPVKAIYDKKKGRSFVIMPLVPGLKTAGAELIKGDTSNTVSLETASKLVTFDYIIGNPDRHVNNIAYTPEGHALLIDHGYCFGNWKFFGLVNQQAIPSLTKASPLFTRNVESMISRAKDPVFLSIVDQSYKDLPPKVRQHAKRSLSSRLEKTPSSISLLATGLYTKAISELYRLKDGKK